MRDGGTAAHPDDKTTIRRGKLMVIKKATLLCILVTLSLISSSLASPIVYNFTGVAIDKTDDFLAVTNDAISGTFIYDSSWSQSFSTPDLASYYADNDNYGIIIQFNGNSYSSRNKVNSINSHVVEIVNDRPLSSPIFDEFAYSSYRVHHIHDNYAPDDDFFAIDFTSPYTVLPSYELPTEINLSDFNRSALGYLELYDEFGQKEAYVEFEITTLTRVEPVPEPSTVFLLGSGLAGLGLYARKRKKLSGSTGF